MNGGAGSTLPIRNPITRPVSFHSLSEHNPNNQVYLSPHPHRRPRTPRSSPLAGPSLSPDQADGETKDEEGSQKPRYRPNRISSTPDMAARTQSLYNPDTSSAVSDSSIGIVVFPPTSTSSASSSSDEDDKEKGLSKGIEEAEDGSRLRNIAKRLSIVSTSSLTTNETDRDSHKAKKKRSSFLLHSTSTTSLASTSSSSRTTRTGEANQTAPPIPTIPRWALNAMREEAGDAKRDSKYGHRRGTSHDSPSLSNQSGAPLSASGLSNQSRAPSVSRDPKENWMSVTDPTPKFSRLGLGGDGVVLPVKKRESMPKMKGSTPIKNARSTATISQSKDATRRDAESNPGRGSNDYPNVTTTPDANLKQNGLRKRSSSVGSLKAKIPKISVFLSTDGENVPPPLPSSIDQSGSGPTPLPTPIVSASKTPGTTVFPSVVDPPNARGGVRLRRDSTLAAINENRSPPGNTEIETKPQDTRKTRTRRKSIKQIVMRITTAPSVTGERLKFGSIHNTPSSKPVVVLPPDTLMPLDPPPPAFFRKRASSSVPCLPFTKENSEVNRNQGEARGGKRFKGIRKTWNAVLETVRR